jgi:hypothetical protein
MFTNEYEKRIKRLEEEICYLHKDMANLINIYENMTPEIHYHTYLDLRTCKGNDQSESNDINDFI